jgi:DNA repair exonuclease SbcCD ATPase subunit
MTWQPASLFINEAEITADEPACQWVWLYRAPWAWLAEGDNADAVAALQQWQAQQRAVLQLRRHLRQRLILVNVDRVAAQPLAERLGLPYFDEQSTLAASKPLVSMLASLLEHTVPECWTLYEALEAAAWLPEGEPEFRSNRVTPPKEGLGELLELIHAGRQLPSTSKLLDERNIELQYVSEELNSTQARADSAMHEADTQLAEHERVIQNLRLEMDKALAAEQSRQEESELLLVQLHQVQEDLEKHHLDNVSLKDEHAKLKQELAQVTAGHQQLIKELDIARVSASKAEQARGKIAEEEARLRKETVNIRKGSQSLAEENEQFLVQLHQVQEELENYYLANREILAAMGQSEHTLHRARNVISRLAAHV